MVGQVGDDLVARLWERNRALEESEQRFRGLVDDSPEPLVVHIAQKIAYANLAAARAFGLDTTAALIGRSILDLATPETKRQILARMATPSELRALDVVEQVFLRPDDGLELHVEVHSVRIEFAGQPAMLSVARDITRRVAAERLAAAALHELEFERLRIGSLLASSTAFMAVTRGKDHVFELANAAYCKLVGRDELIGKATIDAVPEIRGQGMIEMLDKVFETGVPFAGKSTPVRLRYGGTDVEQRYIDFTCQPLRQADGTTSGVFTHGVDVTEATVAQQRLRAQFDGVPVPTYVWQRVARDAVQQFVLVDFNRAALAISRNGIERFRGTTAATFFVDNPEITDEIERCFATGESSVRELDRTLISTGQRKRLLVTYTAVPPDVVVVHTEDVMSDASSNSVSSRRRRWTRSGASRAASRMTSTTSCRWSSATRRCISPISSRRIRSGSTSRRSTAPGSAAWD